MTAIWTRLNSLLLLLLLVLSTLVGLAGMLAAGVLGPLDSPGPPSATDSERLLATVR